MSKANFRKRLQKIDITDQWKQVWPDGFTVWRHANNNIHRYDGPAEIYTSGHLIWKLNGRNLSFDRWIEELSIIDEEHATMMKLEWG